MLGAQCLGPNPLLGTSLPKYLPRSVPGPLGIDPPRYLPPPCLRWGYLGVGIYLGVGRCPGGAQCARAFPRRRGPPKARGRVRGRWQGGGRVADVIFPSDNTGNG